MEYSVNIKYAVMPLESKEDTIHPESEQIDRNCNVLLDEGQRNK